MPPAASEMKLLEIAVWAPVMLSIRRIPPGPPKASRSTTKMSPSSAKVTSAGNAKDPLEIKVAAPVTGSTALSAVFAESATMMSPES